MKSIKLSELLKIVKPQYIYLKLTPDTSIRNYNSSSIAKAIHHSQKSINQRIHKEEKQFKFLIEKPAKCSYLIDIYKDKVEFYFIVPQQFVSIAKEKIRETWAKCTIEEVPKIKPFQEGAMVHEVVYKKEDALSLDIDKKSNEPLNNILNVINIMESYDRVSILYNFIPCDQRGWNVQHDQTIKKIKERKPIDKEKFNSKFILKYGFIELLGLLDMFLDTVFEFIGSSRAKGNEQLNLLDLAVSTLNAEKDLQTATKKKRNTIVINTQFMVISESQDKIRKLNNATGVCQAYKSIDGDNELKYNKIKSKKPIDITNYSYKTQINKCSIDEIANFIQLPGRELLQEYKMIGHKNTLEVDVPAELQQGTKCIGTVRYNDQTRNAYLTNDKDYKNLAVAVIGPTRSGKTSFLGNIARNCIDAGECVIVLDYIENCGLSEDIKKCIPHDKILEINLHDFNNIQGLGYNEAFTDSQEPFIVYDSANKQANQLMALVNSTNDDSELKARMERYLQGAAKVVFINNGPIRHVFEILQDYDLRHKYINMIPDNQIENLKKSVMAMEELDEWSKATKDNPAEIVGTRISNVQGILNRVNKLEQNTFMELMLKKDCTNNINLLDEMQKNQAIFIKMPENMFGTSEERDIMTTYWLTKIWMAAQARAWKITDRYQRKTVNVFTDEIAQLENAEWYVGSKLDQTAKFGVKFIISTMYINQLKIRQKLRTANTSYILISGSDKENYKELKEELSQFKYELEDLMNLPRFHSLNYIKYEKGYTAFITKLPKPLV